MLNGSSEESISPGYGPFNFMVNPHLHICSSELKISSRSVPSPSNMGQCSVERVSLFIQSIFIGGYFVPRHCASVGGII